MTTPTEIFTQDILGPRSLNSPKFYNALRDSSALISGGSVLYSIIKSFSLQDKLKPGIFKERYWKNTDLDIYVNAKNAKIIKDFLCSISSGQSFYQINKNNTFYCNGFLRKNRIIRVLRFGGLNVDLMIVRNNRKLEDVINNFDLGCCMNYFDATEWQIKSRYLSSSKDLIFTTGKIDTSLNPEYAAEFYRGNAFILKRFSKYSLRGFYIQIPPLSSEIESQIVPWKDGSFYPPRAETVPYKYINTLIFTTVFQTQDHENQEIYNFRHLFLNALKNSPEFPYGYNGQYRVDYITLDDEDFTCRKDYEKIGYEKLHDLAFHILKTYISGLSDMENLELKERLEKEWEFYRKFKFSGFKTS